MFPITIMTDLSLTYESKLKACSRHFWRLTNENSISRILDLSRRSELFTYRISSYIFSTKFLSLSKDSENHNPRDPPRDGTSTGGSSAGGGGPGPGASSKRNKQTAPDEFLRTFHEALDVLEEAMREQNFFTSFSRQMTDVAQAFAQSAHFGGFEFHTRRFTRLVVLSAGVSHPRFRNLKHFLGIVVERLLELSHNSPAPFALCYFAVWSVGHTGSG